MTLKAQAHQHSTVTSFHGRRRGAKRAAASVPALRRVSFHPADSLASAVADLGMTSDAQLVSGLVPSMAMAATQAGGGGVFVAAGMPSSWETEYLREMRAAASLDDEEDEDEDLDDDLEDDDELDDEEDEDFDDEVDLDDEDEDEDLDDDDLDDDEEEEEDEE